MFPGCKQAGIVGLSYVSVPSEYIDSTVYVVSQCYALKDELTVERTGKRNKGMRWKVQQTLVALIWSVRTGPWSG